MSAQSPIVYDPETDSMYVVLGPEPAATQIVKDDRDRVIDVDDAGNVVGYDIQHASRRMDVAAEAMALLR